MFGRELQFGKRTALEKYDDEDRRTAMTIHNASSSCAGKMAKMQPGVVVVVCLLPQLPGRLAQDHFKASKSGVCAGTSLGQYPTGLNLIFVFLLDLQLFQDVFSSLGCSRTTPWRNWHLSLSRSPKKDRIYPFEN